MGKVISDEDNEKWKASTTTMTINEKEGSNDKERMTNEDCETTTKLGNQYNNNNNNTSTGR